MSDIGAQIKDQVAPGNAGQRLTVTLNASIEAAAGDQNLLLAFYFGRELDIPADQSIVDSGLEPIDGNDRYECWWYRGNVERRMVGDIRLVECDDYAFLVIQREDVPSDLFRKHTFDAYRDLLSALSGTRQGHLVKIWNYFPDINDGDGDAEKYRQFSFGRAEAFRQAGILDNCVPSGTAIGCARRAGLSIIALVSKHEFSPTENPRQISAYTYPRQYGPRSPKFSRGGCVVAEDHRLYLISGTASIVGHKSVHPFATELQTDETLENLEYLSRALTDVPAGNWHFELDSDCILRVYLRDPRDVESVAGKLADRVPAAGVNTVFLHASICRRELMIEIDGVKVV